MGIGVLLYYSSNDFIRLFYAEYKSVSVSRYFWLIVDTLKLRDFSLLAEDAEADKSCFAIFYLVL